MKALLQSLSERINRITYELEHVLFLPTDYKEDLLKELKKLAEQTKLLKKAIDDADKKSGLKI